MREGSRDFRIVPSQGDLLVEVALERSSAPFVCPVRHLGSGRTRADVDEERLMTFLAIATMLTRTALARSHLVRPRDGVVAFDPAPDEVRFGSWREMEAPPVKQTKFARRRTKSCYADTTSTLKRSGCASSRHSQSGSASAPTKRAPSQ